MSVISSFDDYFEHTPEMALASGCSFCKSRLFFPYVHYNLGRHVFMCHRCCTNGEGILLDMFKVRRLASRPSIKLLEISGRSLKGFLVDP